MDMHGKIIALLNITNDMLHGRAFFKQEWDDLKCLYAKLGRTLDAARHEGTSHGKGPGKA